MAKHYDYVLVGAGLASAMAAKAIREHDASGSILLIGAEPHLPYHRPLLSKEYLRGDASPEDLLIQPAGWYESCHIETRLGIEVTGLDTATKTVTLTGGDAIGYGKLLLATGSSPKPLEVPGGDGPNVHVLRTWDDSDGIRSHLGQKIILVGGGYIGVEVAADFVLCGGQATIIEPTDHLWSKFASPEFGAFLQLKLEAAGVEIILGDEVTEITPTGVKTKTGKTVAGDLVLAAVGVKPNLDITKAAGLDIDDKKGVLVNERMETSAPGVYAAGDIAGFHDPVLGKQWRVEHWNNAVWHGEIAGANMAGVPTDYDHVAHFFSDELDIHFELFGDPQGGKGGLFHGEPSTNRFDELYVNEQGQVAMIISVNPPDDLLPVLEQIARSRPSVRGFEAEIQAIEFDLRGLLV